MKLLWLAWFIFFLVAEGYAVLSGKDTLSSTWVWTITSLPPIVAIPIASVTGGVLLWLVGPHWIFRAYDVQGLDIVEILTITIGLMAGAIGGAALVNRPEEEDVVE